MKISKYLFAIIFLGSLNLLADDSHVIGLYFSPNKGNPQSATIYLLEQGPSKVFPLISFYQRLKMPVQTSSDGIPSKAYKSNGRLPLIYCANGAADIANCVIEVNLAKDCTYDIKKVILKCEILGKEASEYSSLILNKDETRYSLQLVGAKTQEEFSFFVKPDRLVITFKTP